MLNNKKYLLVLFLIYILTLMCPERIVQANDDSVSISHNNHTEYVFSNGEKIYAIKYGQNGKYDVLNLTDNKDELRHYVPLHIALAYLVSKGAEPIKLYPKKVKEKK